MPRWAQITLTLVLYAAATALVWWALKTWVPGAVIGLDRLIGEVGSAILIFGLIVAAGVFGFWPRNPDGTMRRLLPRRE